MNEPRLAALDVHVSPIELRAELERDVVVGLGSAQKWLPPIWFYDERGCALFDEITRLPEYYQTRTEHQLLAAHAAEIAAQAGCDVLVELGSGTSEKTRRLLDAMRQGGLARFVPFDISGPTLEAAGEALVAEYPGLEVHAIVGDFRRHLDRIPAEGRRLVAFLGGTIGNLTPPQRGRFLFDLDAVLATHDRFLLGVDLVKDRQRLVRAYDDSAGVTAEFNRNVLHVLNRELGADFQPDLFSHVVRWDDGRQWIEMRLRSRADQSVHIGDLGMEVRFRAGEDLLTEISAKFTPDRLRDELLASGLIVERSFTDGEGDFLLVLARPYC